MAQAHRYPDRRHVAAVDVSKPRHQDPEKRAAKALRRKKTRELIAAGVKLLPRQRRRSGLTDHGSSPRKRRHRREGEALMERERGEAQ